VRNLFGYRTPAGPCRWLKLSTSVVANSFAAGDVAAERKAIPLPECVAVRALHELAPHAARYGVAAVLVGSVYIGLTLALSGPAGVPIELVIPIALAAAVILHFILQRRFVFVDRGTFALSSAVQARRYVVIVAIQAAGTTVATAILPELLGTTEQVVYIVTVVAISAFTFLFLRSRVFHAS
jgi:putative flippase GtrA